MIDSLREAAWYPLLYRVGFKPWERDEPSTELVELIEGDEAVPPGRALDVGCGTGTHAVYLASRGWRVTGVDYVGRALDDARRRAGQADVEVDWREADVTRLDQAGVEPGFDLVYDRGCFHGLPARSRDACARGLTELAAPEATLLLMGFVPGRRGPLPAGVSGAEIESRFGSSWELLSAEPSRDPGPGGLLRNAQPTWYLLRKR